MSLQPRSAPRPLDQSLWRSIQEDEFGIKLLLQLQLARLSHLKQTAANESTWGREGRRLSVSVTAYQEDVGAEFEDAVDTGQLLEHDGVTDPAEELPDELPDHQHHRRIQSHDAAGP